MLPILNAYAKPLHVPVLYWSGPSGGYLALALQSGDPCGLRPTTSTDHTHSSGGVVGANGQNNHGGACSDSGPTCDVL